jgi:tRNA A37 threonylcarbamoyladenosine modification protein TsaB
MLAEAVKEELKKALKEDQALSIWTAMDARRMEVYEAFFDASGMRISQDRPQIIDASWADRPAAIGQVCATVGFASPLLDTLLRRRVAAFKRVIRRIWPPGTPSTLKHLGRFYRKPLVSPWIMIAGCLKVEAF